MARAGRGTSALAFWLLGEFMVTIDGATVHLTEGEQRLLLMLLGRANRVVPAEDVIERLWPRHPAERSRHLLHTYVSALRRALDPDRRGLLRHAPTGYQLRIEDAQLDALRFLRLLRAGQQHLDLGHPAAARDMLDAGLRLWRTPLPSLTDLERASADLARRLTVAWHSAVEAANEARVLAGDHRSVVVELELLVAQQPLNERFVRQLMVAHYRSGNPTAALQAYAACAAALGERGLVPGPELRSTELAVVRHDRALAPRPPPRAVPPPVDAATAAVACVFLSGNADPLAYPGTAEVDLLIHERGGHLLESAARRRVAGFANVEGALSWALSVVSGPSTVNAHAPAAGVWLTDPPSKRSTATWQDVVVLAQRARPGTVAVCGDPAAIPDVLPEGYAFHTLDGPPAGDGRRAVLLAAPH